VEDIIKSIKAYLYDRSVSPLFGAFILSWCVWNYKFLLVIFSTQEVASKFELIDALYKSISISFEYFSFDVSPRLVNGLILPVITTYGFLYYYPRLAKPVYEYSLKRQQELNSIKKQNSEERLLSVSESRELNKKLAMLESEYDQELKEASDRIKALTEAISNFEKRAPIKDESSIVFTDDKIDELILLALGAMDENAIFQISDLFLPSQWEALEANRRQKLGRSFKAKVKSGVYPDVALDEKYGTQQLYRKISPGKLSPSSHMEKVLSAFVGTSELGISVSQISESLDLHIEEIRLAIDKLMGISFIGTAPAGPSGSRYKLLPLGREYVINNNLHVNNN
jgi:hypothetical protein